MSREDWDGFTRRTRVRGLADTWRILQGRRFMWRRATFERLRNLATVKLEKRLRRDLLRGRPYRFKLDPTNTCGLRCPLCPSGLGVTNRPAGFMDTAVYRRIIDQIAPHALILDLFGWGEPLLHPQFFDMLHYAERRNIYTRMSTTLSIPDWDGAEQLVNAGLDAIIIAVDGATQESYAHYRRGGRLDDVLANIRAILEARRRLGRRTPHLTARMLVHKHNEHELETVRALARDFGADAFSVGLVALDTDDPQQADDWLPSDPVMNAYADGLVNAGACDDLWEGMVINWDGGVEPCCWMYDPQHDLGNLGEESVEAVWNSAGFRASRNVVAGRGEQSAASACSRCGGRPWYLGTG